MKVLLINGSPHQEGCTFTALMEVARVLQQEGAETEIFHLGKKPIEGCRACRTCRAEHTEFCVIADDVVNTLLPKVYEADAYILGSPVYFSGISGQMKSALDRVFSVGLSKMRNKLGASVVSCRRGGATSTFDQLNHYFTIAEVHIVASQYWNQVHGNTPEEVRQDLEGLQTMRTLGRNMAWLLKCVELARCNGLPEPARETRVATNFIR
jgi:multimeric flavodoxin WrbA